MGKFAVVYWSGTGNTEAMANAIVEEIKGLGAEADLFSASDFNSSLVNNYAGIAFGCPAMGAEQLEGCEFEPMFLEVKGALAGKNIALFGSYGWGDGEWMREWRGDCESVGANIVCEPVIANDAPDAACFAELSDLSKALVA